MASKRKHSTLTLKDKLEVLKRLDKGEGVTKLEGSDDETQCDKKDVVPHANGAAALALALRATWSNSPTLHQLMCYL
ncbi:hypothetical protein TNCV_2983441 [Trichonephila clavipes]|nr:hypothetical protein TNCV_2983441 [Trichonephila clavipes]